MDPTMKRSIAPIFWLLFGAGGMLAALTGPALVLITGLAGDWPFSRFHVIRARVFVRPKPVWQAHLVWHNRFVYLARCRANFSDLARHACRRQVDTNVDLLWQRWRTDCCYRRSFDDHWN
jgi:fumarate reductase subunit D